MIPLNSPHIRLDLAKLLIRRGTISTATPTLVDIDLGFDSVSAWLQVYSDHPCWIYFCTYVGNDRESAHNQKLSKQEEKKLKKYLLEKKGISI